MRLLFFFITLFIITASFGHAKENLEPLPTDSSSSISNRLAAAYLIDDGKKLFTQGRKLDALQRFREAYTRDKFNAKAAYWIGETHFDLNNYGYAKDYGLLAETLSKESDGEISFLLGKSYHRLNILDSALLHFDMANNLLPLSKKTAYKLSTLVEEVKYAQSLADKETVYQKKLLNDNINSGYNDYAPFLTSGGKEIYYVSRRPDTKGGNTNPSDQQFFEDIYYAKWNDETNDWGESTNELDRLNSEGFDAVNHISEDGTQLFMTVNTSILNIGNPTRSSDIFIAELSKDGTWGRPKPIKNKTINTSFFDGAPTITADGNTMYFVSDRDGTRSKSDIYVVEKDGRKWGVAKKLPMNVNTKENETTPFISPDGRFLFYSSDGLGGMGGYDIYVTEKLGDNIWSDPINLGQDFNTVNDDIFFKYFPELKKGVIAGYNIVGKRSSIDIYEINLDDWKIPVK